MAEYESLHGGLLPGLLNGVLPNQDGILRSPADLERDAGIDEELKGISLQLGCPLRARLLHHGFFTGENSAQLQSFLKTHVPRAISEADAADQLITQVQKSLPGESRPSPSDTSLLGSIRLLSWLARRPTNCVTQARKIPLLTQEGEVRVASAEPILFLPPTQWHHDAEPYSSAFPKQRLLSEVYVDTVPADERPGLLDALIRWRMVYADIVTTSTSKLEDRKLVSLCQPQPSDEKHEVSGVECSVIPYWHEAIGGTGQDRERARKLLHLLLKYIVVKDSLWRGRVQAQCKRHPGETLYFAPSVWLGNVLTDRWIATLPDGEDQIIQVKASPESVGALIDWAEPLTEAADELLTRLGFDRLDLTIRRIPGSDQQLGRDQLADLISYATSDPEVYSRIVQKVKDEQKEKERVEANRRMGKRVERLIESLLKDAGFTVLINNPGYDLLAYRQGVADIDWDFTRLQIGRYFIEVKASKGNEAKMTPTQVKFAVEHPEEYVLCVVDLKHDKHADYATLEDEDIKSSIMMVDDIGYRVEATHNGVQNAPTIDIRLDYTQQLRYCVRRKVWESALNLTQWFDKAKGSL